MYEEETVGAGGMANVTINAINNHMQEKLDLYWPILEKISKEAEKGLDEIYLKELDLKGTDTGIFTKYLRLMGYEVEGMEERGLYVQWDIYIR